MTVKKVNEHLNLSEAEYIGLSTDVKPTNCGTGSTFWELDTKRAFLYDGISAWYEV